MAVKVIPAGGTLARHQAADQFFMHSICFIQDITILKRC